MAVKFQYCSDLHLEMELNQKYISKYPLPATGDILLLGGDIMLFARQTRHNDFLDFVSRHYQAVYWIPGNHEYYHDDIRNKCGTMNMAVRDNVFLVNNTTIHIGDIDLICSTLWSKIDPAAGWEVTRAMNDFQVIRNGDAKLSIDDYNALHNNAFGYLVNALNETSTQKQIVLTHHVPTMMNYPEQFKGSILNQAFAVELFDLVENCGVAYWLYGHTHHNTPEFTIGKTRLITNQLGYVRYGENRDFDPGKFFVL